MTTPTRRRGSPTTFIPLLAGIGLGLLVGWLAPVQRFTTGFDRLHPDYKADYVVMVGSAYLLDGDWPTAEARLIALGEENLPTYVGELTERYITEGRSVNDIRGLVSLSAALGYTSPAMEPYLPARVPGG
jgi:hypothetical protein